MALDWRARADLIEEVEQNLRSLNSCPGPHQFPPYQRGKKDYHCLKCGGVLGLVNMLWYMRGLADGRKFPEEKKDA